MDRNRQRKGREKEREEVSHNDIAGHREIEREREGNRKRQNLGVESQGMV